MTDKQIEDACKLKAPHRVGTIAGVVRLGKSYYAEEAQINDPDLQVKNCLMKPAPWFTPVTECAYLEQPIKTTQPVAMADLQAVKIRPEGTERKDIAVKIFNQVGGSAFLCSCGLCSVVGDSLPSLLTRRSTRFPYPLPPLRSPPLPATSYPQRA